MRGPMRSPGRPSKARREDRVRFWEAIAGGVSSEDAAAGAGVSPAVGSRWFRQAGGMPPISLGSVSGRYLSFAEREEIAIFCAQGVGVREIGRRVGRCASTISRELRRNAATRSRGVVYRATTAQWHAERRASRPKVAKLAANDELREYVQDRLGGQIARPDGELVPGPQVRWTGRRHGRRADRRWATSWSPEQISRRLRIDFPDNESMRISHEAIYQALYVQGRGALKRELVACLRTGRALRVPRARTRQRRRTFVSPEIMISQRPAEADDRAVPGHWEGDLILGLRSSAIGTLVERTTRFTMLGHLPPMPGHRKQQRVHNGPPLAGHGAQAVRDAIAASIITLPQQLRKLVEPGTKESKWLSMLNSAQRPTSTSTSATRRVHGSVEPTRTPTVCSANTSPKAPTSTDTHATTSTLSPQHSTADPAKPSAGGLQPRPSTNTYTPSNKAVLQRPLEPGQYLSIRYTNRLAEAGISPSVGSVGDSLRQRPRGVRHRSVQDRTHPTEGTMAGPGPSRVRHPRVRRLVQPPKTPRTNRTHPTSTQGGQLPSSTKASPASWTQVKHSPANPVRFMGCCGVRCGLRDPDRGTG